MLEVQLFTSRDFSNTPPYISDILTSYKNLSRTTSSKSLYGWSPTPAVRRSRPPAARRASATITTTIPHPPTSLTEMTISRRVSRHLHHRSAAVHPCHVIFPSTLVPFVYHRHAEAAAVSRKSRLPRLCRAIASRAAKAAIYCLVVGAGVAVGAVVLLVQSLPTITSSALLSRMARVS